MRKPAFAYAKTKTHNHEADQRLCFRYMDSTIPLLFKPLAKLCGYTACVGPGRKPRRPVFSQRGSVEALPLWTRFPEIHYPCSHTVQPDSFSTVGAFSTVATVLDES